MLPIASGRTCMVDTITISLGNYLAEYASSQSRRLKVTFAEAKLQSMFCYINQKFQEFSTTETYRPACSYEVLSNIRAPG